MNNTNRLTVKIGNEYSTSDYLMELLSIDEKCDDLEVIAENQLNIIKVHNKKLGPIEDLLEKYDIKDLPTIYEKFKGFIRILKADYNLYLRRMNHKKLQGKDYSLEKAMFEKIKCQLELLGEKSNG